MSSKFRLLIVAVLVNSILLSATFMPAYAQTIQHGGTLHLGLPNTIDNFSQFLTTSYQAWYFLQMCYPNFGIPVAGSLLHVAVSNYWSNPSADTWYFQIRPGMTWSDGVPVNATDLAYSIQLMFSSYTWGAGSLSSYQQYLKGGLNSAIKIDNSTVVEVDLNQPLGTLGDTIGSENTPNLTPYHIWKNYLQNGTAPGSNFGTMVGAGAYYVSNFHQGDTQVTLLPNPYGSPFGGDAQGKPYLDQITVQLVPTTADMSLLLKGGSVDAAPVSPADVAGLTSNPSFKTAYGPTPDTWVLEYPIWNYPYNMSAFRKAMAYAINRTDLVQTALAGYGLPGSEGYLPPGNSPEFNANVPNYDFNPQQAESLLQSLGWTKDSAGFYAFPNGTEFTPTIYAPAENQPIVTAGSRTVSFLRAVGINAKLQSIALTSMVNIWAKGTNMYFYEQNYGYPWPALLFDYSFDGFGSGPPLTHPVFWPSSVEAQYNQTLAQLNAQGTEQGRDQYMQQLQQMIAENLPSITMFYVDSVWVYNTQNFAGWPTPPGTLDWPGGEFNMTALASIYSLSAQSAQSTSMAQPTSMSSTSTTAPTGSTDMTPYIAGGVVVVIALIAVGLYSRRKRA